MCSGESLFCAFESESFSHRDMAATKKEEEWISLSLSATSYSTQMTPGAKKGGLGIRKERVLHCLSIPGCPVLLHPPVHSTRTPGAHKIYRRKYKSIFRPFPLLPPPRTGDRRRPKTV